MQQIKQVINRIRRKIYKIKIHPFYFLAFPYRLATAKRRALPDFLIISTQKGGTTSLLRLLEQHPQIHAPHTELHYFSNDSNYQKGSLWYRSHLPLRSALVPGDVAGEKTPGYLFSSKAAETINEALPIAKLTL